MHDWLKKEADAVRWRKFFVFKRDADPVFFEMIEKQFGVLPTDYKQFVTEFGDSRLFRSLDDASYHVAVFSPYDLDGNLSSDGRWNYTWDAENRLIKMESLAGAPAASVRRLSFQYDWMG